MPAHSSHLLHPLDVGCFSPLKRAYSEQIMDLIKLGVHHVDKDPVSLRLTAVSR
jgi:hypothetical protein